VFNKGGKPYISVQYRGETKEFVRVWLIKQRSLSDYHS
jgi:hypothetical protein